MFIYARALDDQQRDLELDPYVQEASAYLAGNEFLDNEASGVNAKDFDMLEAWNNTFSQGHPPPYAGALKDLGLEGRNWQGFRVRQAE